MFCLCSKFVPTSFSSAECVHTRDEIRALTVTCVMDEVGLAVETFYRILKIYEVYKYQVIQYYPETGEGGLLVNYINTFLKLIAEASGYPG